MASGTQKMEGRVHRISTSHLVQGAQKDVKPLQTFMTKFSNDWATSFASLIAYSLLTAMLPIAVALFGILGLVLGSNSGLTSTIAHNLASIVPQTSTSSSSPTATQQAIELAVQQLNKQAGFLLIIAIVLAIFGGSRLFITLENCLNIVYRLRPRTAIKQNLMAFAMLILFIILIPLMVFASAAPTVILSVVSNVPGLSTIPFFSAIARSPILGYLAGLLGGFIVAFILFEAIYFVVPNQKISWRNSWCGAVVAAIALELFLLLFPIYIRYGLKNYTGQVGFAVILLLFFYYFAVILMIGAEVNAFFFEKIQPLPNNLVTFVSTMGGKLNRDFPESESDSHVDTHPTESADAAHIASARTEEERTPKKNRRRQKQIVTAAKNKEQSVQDSKKPSKLPVALEVIAGSALAVGVELLRLRQRGK
jgi:YihY family inner membrane protein